MHIDHPRTGLLIYLGMGFIIYNFGLQNGAIIIFDIGMATLVYFMITYRRR